MASLTQHRPQSNVARELGNSFHFCGNARDHLGCATSSSADWEELRASWDDLERDPYMADGGAYRSRRYSEFEIDPCRNNLLVLPHVPFTQSLDFNYLNGGIDRNYLPITEQTIENPVFRQILMSCAVVLESLHPATRWRAQVFQNRIWARPSEKGNPTPEGVHRDGVDYVLTLLGNRYQIEGGESFTYLADRHTKVAATTLADPGEFIFLDDVRMSHGVTPITCTYPEQEGYRDVLVAMYSLL
ncbi:MULTISPECIES: 2OG-Fe dioxygenase family protein [Pseudomonas syringae group]|uniref:2OG-Fe dioxygenase family protein n=1 Tax=Pseudomonas syringae group TaxID=136849 RepID=UPI000CD1E01E|nr:MULTISPECIES: 2OG-Fe dioxygenase family protein [Pseudomonas syringae group]MBS7422900.1 2OG-Fe dioxygenase family protein [Pseudomonas syringae]MBS7434637.1 2OG-Fe dioxygenase family protein [Pseudomonas syringae]MCF5737161.1 hypothetical protein [Pseudomonas syringae]MCF5742435.1 hypothetical protein [Pseudomonas syringae]MCF5753063.1 hypothetical protein [Pseudomonas syringae]